MDADQKNGWIVVGVVLSLVAIVFFGPGMWALVVLVALIAVAVAGGIWLFNAIAGPKPAQRSPTHIVDDDDEAIDVEVRVVDPTAGLDLETAKHALEAEWRRLQSEKDCLEAEKRAFHAEKKAFEENHRVDAIHRLVSPENESRVDRQIISVPASGTQHSKPKSTNVATIVAFGVIGTILLTLVCMEMFYRNGRFSGDAGSTQNGDQHDESVSVEESPASSSNAVVAERLPQIGEAAKSESASRPNGPPAKVDRTSRAVTRHNAPLKIVDAALVRPSPAGNAQAQQFVQKGVLAADSGDYNLALRNLSEGIRLSPSNAMAFCYRGFVHTKSGNFKSADADISNSLKLDPKGANPNFFMGYLRLRERRFDEAIVWFGHAIRINPDLVKAYVFRSEAYDAQGNAKKAEADLSRVRQIDAQGNRK